MTPTAEVFGVFIFSWFATWILSSIIFGVKSIMQAAYGRNRQSQ